MVGREEVVRVRDALDVRPAGIAQGWDVRCEKSQTPLQLEWPEELAKWADPRSSPAPEPAT